MWTFATGRSGILRARFGTAFCVLGREVDLLGVAKVHIGIELRAANSQEVDHVPRV
jgi:hypothetical protein